MKPALSIVVEGYNDSLGIGSALETLDALAAQTMPSDRLEVILVGSEEQAEYWRNKSRSDGRFASLQCVAATGAHYYALKNFGAAFATADLLAFLDSDALPDPNWAEVIVRGLTSGASAVAGISLYRPETGSYQEWLLEGAASISWGFIVHDPPKGFLSHNFGILASVFRSIRFREDLGRTCAGTFFFEELERGAYPIRMQFDQRVRHNFGLKWWVTRLHVRFGYEVYLLKRLRTHAQHRWASRLGLVEPVATAIWHVLLDIPQWFRFARALGKSRVSAVLLTPAVVLLAFGARGAELYGMYGAMVAPAHMKEFAQSN